MIWNKDKVCIIKKNQLPLYVRREKRIGKSCVIYILEMGFTLLNKKNEHIILALTECAVENNGIYSFKH